MEEGCAVGEEGGFVKAILALEAVVVRLRDVVPTVAYPTAVVVLQVVASELVLQVVASELVLQVVLASDVTLPSRGCRRRLVVVRVAFRVVLTNGGGGYGCGFGFSFLLQELLVLLALLLELRSGHYLRVVLGALVGQLLLMLL